MSAIVKNKKIKEMSMAYECRDSKKKILKNNNNNKKKACGPDVP